MIGPVGRGPLNYVPGSAVPPAQIDFENSPMATKQVIVTPTLNSGLDLRTLTPRNPPQKKP